MSTPSGDYLTPIQPEAISAAETLPVGSLIARRGWISKFGYRAICPEVLPRLDPNADGGLGSPFVHCPGSAGRLSAGSMLSTRTRARTRRASSRQPDPVVLIGIPSSSASPRRTRGGP